MREIGGKLVIATHNPGKLREIAALIEPLGIATVGAEELHLPEPEEIGNSFADNADLKAREAADLSGLPALADDSGLCVDALHGRPGIFSARWAEDAEGNRDWEHPVNGKKSRNKLYDGTVFHRVIPSFMIQGGDPAGTGFGGPGYQFADETKGSPHKFDKSGKLAMANAGPNTNGSQFFITVAAAAWLTGKHTIFGEVVEGYDVVEKIANVPRSRQDKPLHDVLVKSVRIERT